MNKYLFFTLLLTAFTVKPLVAAPAGFDQRLEMQGVRFHITSSNAGSINRLHIQPSGKLKHAKPISREIYGTVTWAEIADLNADGWPELYVAVTSAGSGGYGTVIGYVVNKGKSLSEVALPELNDDPVASAGYMGHDEFAIVESTLARRFPIYQAGDSNAAPTGGKRQLHYRLQAGEATWLLKLDKQRSQNF